MKPEYDFSGSTSVRGKYHQAYRAGHSVRIQKTDGIVEEQHFTLADGAVMLDPDLKAGFPNSDAVNNALRSLTLQD